MIRDIMIGDVHGCLEELDELVALVAPSSGDRLFFLGDLVDRGPDSVGVIRRVKELLARHPGSVCVAGNHEEKNLRLHEKGRAPRAWWSTARDEDWAFLDALPLFHRVPERGLFLVHGGIYPRLLRQYPELGAPVPSWRRARDKRSQRLSRMLRARLVDPDGQVVALGVATGRNVHWSRRYEGREGFCFFGHDPQLEPAVPLRAPWATGLDTGCCFGGRLTAAVLTAQHARDAEFVSVPARAQYAIPRDLHSES